MSFYTLILLVGCLFNVKPIYCHGDGDSHALDELVAEFYEWRVRVWPEYGTKFGINTYNTRIDDYTEEGFRQQKENATALLERTQEIDRDELSQQQKFSKDILENTLQTFIDGYQYRVHSLYNSMAYIDHPMYEWPRIVGYMPKTSQRDFHNILARYRAIPQQVTQRIALMQIAVDQGITLHRYDLERGIAAMDTEINADVEDSAFYAAFKSDALPDTLTDAVKSQLQADCQDVITDDLHPAITQFKTFLERDYLPNARADIGVGSMPNGQNFYRAALRWHLGTDISPREVHQLGLDEVARISALMQTLITEVGFQGTVREYIAHLRAQPEQYYSTSEEVLDGYREIIANAHGQLSTVLHRVPDVPLQVVAGPFNRYSLPSSPDQPGTFTANVADPSDVPKFGMVALALHEAEPGHHTQGVYNFGSGEVPDFRTKIEFLRYNGVPFNWPFQTAYSEGWALYAEYLGEQMGAYSDPTTRFGRYASEIFRASRLVVDTGLHAFGWTFEEAMEYMQNNTAQSDSSITGELKRYIGWPGQACSYKFGELKIKQMLKQAEDAIGDQFDVRDFHHRILAFGDAPFSILEEDIEAWIELETTDPSSARGLHVMSHVIVLVSIATVFLREMLF